CPVPFIDASQFIGSSAEGYVKGRLCFSFSDRSAGPPCCLPCPAIDWIYPPSFRRACRAAAILNVPGLLLCLILLLALGKDNQGERSSRQLSMCLVIGVCSLSLGFVVPLAAKPDECADAITPRDMHSSGACAFSGAFIIFGALSSAVWTFIRTVMLHMHICWTLKPSKKYDYAVQTLGWGTTAIFLSLTLGLTGVSFRFGDTCHVNMQNSIPNFWGPLLFLAGISAMLQFTTFAYCIKNYIDRKFLPPDESRKLSTDLPHSISLPSRFREVQQVLKMQWRSILIVFLILVDVTFFAILFVYLDARESRLLSNSDKVRPWVDCVLTNPTSIDECFGQAEELFIPEAAVIIALLLIAVPGYQCFILVFPSGVKDTWINCSKDAFNR
ncbi:hypothetical protein B0J12DRAFT_533383, partial [Macrophomina phaseolina]